MNYQLMFQTVAAICAIATVMVGMGWIFDAYSNKKRIHILLLVLFIITLITGALAAGLS
jgi:F0F1-type ATP synthase assembly protein I